MITQIVKFNIKDEYINQFKALLEDDKQGGKAETGLLEMRLYQDKNAPGVFFAYERSENQNAVNYHGAQPYTQALLQALPNISVSAPEAMNLKDTTPAPLHKRNLKTPNSQDDIFIIFFIFKIKLQYRAQLLTQFETHITQTRSQEEGNLIFDLYTIEGQDDTLAVYEHWRKESDVWDIHFNQPYAIQTGKLMHKAVVGDLEQYMSFVTEL